MDPYVEIKGTKSDEAANKIFTISYQRVSIKQQNQFFEEFQLIEPLNLDQIIVDRNSASKSEQQKSEINMSNQRSRLERIKIALQVINEVQWEKSYTCTVFNCKMILSIDSSHIIQQNEQQTYISQVQQTIIGALAAIKYSLQKSAENYSNQIQLEKENLDFLYKQQWEFDIDLKKNQQQEQKIMCVVYCPQIFSYITKKSLCNEQTIQKSFDLEKNYQNIMKQGWQVTCKQEGNAAGKSGSFILVSYDKEFLLKILTKEEKDYLMTILPSYCNHLQQNENSYLSRIVGLYSFHTQCTCKLYIMIMKSVIPPDYQIKFDLKGSTFERQAIKNLNDHQFFKRNTYKDLDFSELIDQIFLPQEEYVQTINQLQKDVILLQNMHIIDYSLLLSIDFKEDQMKGEKILNIQFGIIDFLQIFTFRKKCEYYLKKLIGQQNFSVIPPTLYAKRFYNFMKYIFVPDGDLENLSYGFYIEKQ